jgi:hypothetical protein
VLHLPDVTLCCVDSLNRDLARLAMSKSVEAIRFGQMTMCEPPIRSPQDYSEYVLKSLLHDIHTSFVLLIQWDGYVTNPAAWRDEFLDHDYIGAIWSWHCDDMQVGNGGFSLRSRKLLEALQDPTIQMAGVAEDETICRTFRPYLERRHGIRFAPPAVAEAFSFEVGYPIRHPFGFHGLFNFCRVMQPSELIELVPRFSRKMMRSSQMLQLARNCRALGQLEAAAALFERIDVEST